MNRSVREQGRAGERRLLAGWVDRMNDYCGEDGSVATEGLHQRIDVAAATEDSVTLQIDTNTSTLITKLDADPDPSNP